MLVLLVDDEPLILEIAAEMLETLGCEVVTASSGSDAVAKLERDEGIELLVSDISMPGLSGYELAEQAKRMRADIKIILISGRESEGRGFPFLRKPFVEADLARVMHEMNCARPG